MYPNIYSDFGKTRNTWRIILAHGSLVSLDIEDVSFKYYERCINQVFVSMLF